MLTLEVLYLKEKYKDDLEGTLRGLRERLEEVYNSCHLHFNFSKWIPYRGILAS